MSDLSGREVSWRRGRGSRSRGLASIGDFEALYSSMAQRSLVFFTRRTADPEIARDLWAETWTRAYAARESFRGDTRPEAEAWVAGIARKVIAGYYKRGAVEQRAMARLGLERPALGDEDIVRLERMAALTELRAVLESALAELPVGQAEALRLRVIQGYGYDEVARRAGINEQAARARVSRGLRALADRIEPGSAEFEQGNWT